jgi:hypothetical protein
LFLIVLLKHVTGAVFNDVFKPEVMSKGADPGRIPFIEAASPTNDVFVGQQVDALMLNGVINMTDTRAR